MAGGANTAAAFVGGANTAGKAITFDFKPGAQKLIAELEWVQGGVQTHGTWKVQASRDNLNWFDVSNEFLLGGTASQKIFVNTDGQFYRSYRLIGVSGTVNGGPWLYELNCKIFVGPSDGVVLNDPLAEMPVSLREKLISAYLMNRVVGDILPDLVGGTDIDLSTPANQSYKSTSNGIVLTGGVIRIPALDNCVAQSLIVRAPVGRLGSGFLLEGTNGSGFLGRLPDGTATVEKVLTAGQSFRPVRSNFEYGLDRGNWCGYYRERTAFDFAIGGRFLSDGSRSSHIEVAAGLFWSETLTADDEVQLEKWMRQYMLQLSHVMHFDDCVEERDVFIGMGDSMMEGVDLVSNLDASDLLLPGSSALIAASAAGENDSVVLQPYNHYGSAHEENLLHINTNPDTYIDLAKTSPAFGVLYARSGEEGMSGPCVIINVGEGSSYVTPTSAPGANAVQSWHPDEVRSSSANYPTALRAIEACFGQLATMGVRPSKTLRFMWSFGLNEAVSINLAPSAAVYQGWLQDLFDALVAAFPTFTIDVLMMRAHQEDAISDPTALANVRAGTDAFIAANANVRLLDNDGNAKITDGVHNQASVMKQQGVVWHG